MHGNNMVQYLRQIQLLWEILNNTNLGNPFLAHNTQCSTRFLCKLASLIQPCQKERPIICTSLKRGKKAYVYTTINGKIMPMKKKEIQLIEPPIMYAAGRSVWVNSSVVKMFVTPPTAQSTLISLITLVCVYTSVCQCTIIQQQCRRNTDEFVLKVGQFFSLTLCYSG